MNKHTKKMKDAWKKRESELLNQLIENEKNATLPPFGLSTSQIPDLGSGGFFNPDSFYSISPADIDEAWITKPRPEKKKKFVVFFGFTGLLANKCSIIEDTSVLTRLEMSETKVPFKVFNDIEKFEEAVSFLEERPTQIPIEDAFSIIRIGVQPVRVDDYEDAEQDEFDDNCLDTCRPSDHKCGK